jgi:hypothetical protein
MGGSTHAPLSELFATAAFVVLSAVGFRRNLWLVVVGLLQPSGVAAELGANT